MTFRRLLKRFRRFRLKQKLRAANSTIPFAVLKIKKKPMTEKQKNSEKIAELQETLEIYVVQLGDLTKIVGDLRKQVTDLQKSQAELKQLCSLGQ